MKALVGKTETLTYKEVEALRERKMAEFLYYMCGLIDESMEDEEERANAKVNMSELLGGLLSMEHLSGILQDEGEYLALLPNNEGVKIEEVADGD